MGLGSTLQELARQVRSSTLQVFDATRDDWLLWAPQGTTNHILWHAGHAIWLQDLMCVELLSGKSDLPANWTKRFDSRSEPNAIDDWPRKKLVHGLLESQLARIVELLDTTPDDELLRPLRNLSDKRSSLGWIIHGLHDEAKHCGEMYLLWKICKSHANESNKR